MQDQHGLLQVVDGCQGSSSANTGTAMEHNFVVSGYVHELLLIKEVLSATLTPMMNSQVLNDRLDYLVVLLFGRAEVWPRQVLQLGDDTATDD